MQWVLIALLFTGQKYTQEARLELRSIRQASSCFELCNKADQELSNRIGRDKVAARAQNFHYSLECLQTK